MNQNFTEQSKSEERFGEFLFILGFGKLSTLEIESAISSQNFDASLVGASDFCALVRTNAKTARALIKRIGASYKVTRVIGRSIAEALGNLSVPFEPKFDWTISAYDCEQSLYDESFETVHELLREKGLGKSKFLRPHIYSSNETDGQLIRSAELRADDVRYKILSNIFGNPGIDLVIQGGRQGEKPIFAQTVEAFDSKGFEQRDFERPHQDPTKTVSPRMGRILVNLALNKDTTNLLDPFCGLGTVLQEALLCNISVTGVDKDRNRVDRARANLKWVISKYGLSSTLHLNLFAYDARRISHARMPRIDAVATEPILLPIFKTNPTVSQSKALIEKVRRVYERSVSELASLLVKKGDRVALTVPILIDSSGRQRTFDLSETAKDAGFRPYTGDKNFTRDMHYPWYIETSKKKTVQRSLSVFYLS